MAMSTPPSLITILQVTGPCILPFLTSQDILCSLQYASTEIRHLCINSRQNWKDFVHQYSIGPTTPDDLNSNSSESPIVRLVKSPVTVLSHVDKVHNDVLYSIISGIVPAKCIVGAHHDDRSYWRLKKGVNNRLSPFNCVKILDHVWWADSETRLRLFWSGRWGVFWRLRFDQTPVNRQPVMIELAAWYHGHPIETAVVSERQTERSLMNQIANSSWSDVMLGTIDARNVSHDYIAVQYQSRFERLGVPVDIKVRLYNHQNSLKFGQRLDFVYLWPLEDQQDEMLISASLVVSHPRDHESTVELKVIGDVGTRRNH